jgi:Cu/Ag efflux protein CusF
MQIHLDTRNGWRLARRSTTITAVRAVFMAVLIAASTGAAQDEPIAGRVVVGAIVSIQSPSVTVRLPNMLGYLRVRVRTYRVRQPASLVGLKPGDRISGVLSRKDGMLHRVRRIASIRDLQRQL